MHPHREPTTEYRSVLYNSNSGRCTPKSISRISSKWVYCTTTDSQIHTISGASSAKVCKGTIMCALRSSLKLQRETINRMPRLQLILRCSHRIVLDKLQDVLLGTVAIVLERLLRLAGGVKVYRGETLRLHLGRGVVLGGVHHRNHNAVVALEVLRDLFPRGLEFLAVPAPRGHLHHEHILRFVFHNFLPCVAHDCDYGTILLLGLRGTLPGRRELARENLAEPLIDVFAGDLFGLIPGVLHVACKGVHGERNFDVTRTKHVRLESLQLITDGVHKLGALPGLLVELLRGLLHARSELIRELLFAVQEEGHQRLLIIDVDLRSLLAEKSKRRHHRRHQRLLHNLLVTKIRDHDFLRVNSLVGRNEHDLAVRESVHSLDEICRCDRRHLRAFGERVDHLQRH
mmetsp:Transcript_12223/g.32935  ORF Transcript_12223/g.32935 Transcript_12223/m.32935 type:complete len:401 (+) Transcript_12223:471-1673(+)